MTTAHESRRVLVIDGVQCVCTVHHEPDPGAMVQVRSIMVEGLVQALLKQRTTVSD